MTNRFSVRVIVVAGVVVGVTVDHRLRLGKHDGGDGNLYAHHHAVLGCFTGPDVVTPSHGAGRPLMMIENGGKGCKGERGLCVARMLKPVARAPLIKGSWDFRGRWAAIYRDSSPPGEPPTRRTAGMRTTNSHA